MGSNTEAIRMPCGPPVPRHMFSMFPPTPASSWRMAARTCGFWSRVTKAVDPSSWYLGGIVRSEEHTSELQSRFDLVCRLLLEKKITDRGAVRTGTPARHRHALRKQALRRGARRARCTGRSAEPLHPQAQSRRPG